MTITVVNLVEKRKALEVDAFDTVELVKARIEAQEGIPVRLQRLMFADEILEDGKALSGYGVKEGDSLRLLLDLQNIEIFLKTISGKVIPLKVKRSYTMEQIKDAIFKKENVPVYQQRLLVKGELIEDHKTVSDCDIMDGDTIHLIFRLPGGRPY